VDLRPELEIDRGDAVSSAVAVEADAVSVAYRLTRSGGGSIKEFAIRALKRQLVYEYLEAVKGVSFEVRQGQMLAVIGPNGAGKTTLLKLLARVLPPSAGRVRVRGLVAPLIALGAGFNPELTGFENIVLYGTLLGNQPAEMRRRAGAIGEWADLSDFLSVPLRSYSSGMLARLGFAIATECEPDVLLIDEVLSVGDEVFRHRSASRIESLIGRGTAVVLVTHDLGVVTERADVALWLDHGEAVQLGMPSEVVAAYREQARSVVEAS
jgi:ABC-2 type transport system ATP-binding protein